VGTRRRHTHAAGRVWRANLPCRQERCGRNRRSLRGAWNRHGRRSNRRASYFRRREQAHADFNRNRVSDWWCFLHSVWYRDQPGLCTDRAGNRPLRRQHPLGLFDCYAATLRCGQLSRACVCGRVGVGDVDYGSIKLRRRRIYRSIRYLTSLGNCRHWNRISDAGYCVVFNSALVGP